jgi:hypothetical protein
MSPDLEPRLGPAASATGPYVHHQYPLTSIRRKPWLTSELNSVWYSLLVMPCLATQAGEASGPRSPHRGFDPRHGNRRPARDGNHPPRSCRTPADTQPRSCRGARRREARDRAARSRHSAPRRRRSIAHAVIPAVPWYRCNENRIDKLRARLLRGLDIARRRNSFRSSAFASKDLSCAPLHVVSLLVSFDRRRHEPATAEWFKRVEPKLLKIGAPTPWPGNSSIPESRIETASATGRYPAARYRA